MYRAEIIDLYDGVQERIVDDFTFSVGTGMNGGDIDVTCALDYSDTSNSMTQCAVYNDSNSIVAYGILTKKSVDISKQQTSFHFSGVPSLLRGAILTPHYLIGGYTVTSGELAYQIKAGTKIGVINNMLVYTYNKLNPQSTTANYRKSLPFVWGGKQTSGTEYVYNLYNGDFKVLADVISDYIERENVPAFRWTYSLIAANTFFTKSKIGKVNLSQIGTQTSPFRLQTQAILEKSPVTFDSSNNLNIAILAVNIDDNGVQKTRYFGQQNIGASTDVPLFTVGMVQGHGNVTEYSTLEAYAQERANQLTSVSMTVTLSQRYGVSGNNNEVFAPSDIGKVVCFPVLPQHREYLTVGVKPYFVYGVVTEAKYVNNDTVILTLNNVQLQDNDILDITTMNKQTSTPKTVTNLLNTLSNNLGSQSVKPRT